MSVAALDVAPTRRSTGILRHVLAGAVVVGVLDAIDALVFFGLVRGASSQRIFQGVASGLIGRDAARAGGVSTALLGLLLHFLVAFCIVSTYFLLSRWWPLLTRRPVLCGLVFGVVAYFVMSFVVVPASLAAPFRTTLPPLPVVLNGIFGHALLVGLPAALFARRAADATPRS